MKDSTTHVSPASPKARSDIISFTASIVSAFVVGSNTPLPAARPDALTTCLSPPSMSRLSTYAIASFASVKFLYLAVGMSYSSRKSFVKALLASKIAASLVGPKALTSGHSSFKTFTNPSTSGASGPTTTMCAPKRFTKAKTVSLSCLPLTPSALDIFPPSTAVPPLPGQHTTCDTSGDRATATARACSLPPDPTMMTISLRPAGDS
mmetsp:Transcript_9834/g.14369  ORF Transcript_9834/g.14369 Transcript_9834/m.14369 type:complete len:207 (-) Transcript_9834:596-1216(-)